MTGLATKADTTLAGHVPAARAPAYQQPDMSPLSLKLERWPTMAHTQCGVAGVVDSVAHHDTSAPFDK